MATIFLYKLALFRFGSSGECRSSSTGHTIDTTSATRRQELPSAARWQWCGPAEGSDGRLPAKNGLNQNLSSQRAPRRKPCEAVDRVDSENPENHHDRLIMTDACSSSLPRSMHHANACEVVSAGLSKKMTAWKACQHPSRTCLIL